MYVHFERVCINRTANRKRDLITNRTANRKEILLLIEQSIEKEILLLIEQPIEKEILLHERLCYFLINNTGKIILLILIITY